jgi:HEAT repeat protein
MPSIVCLCVCLAMAGLGVLATPASAQSALDDATTGLSSRDTATRRDALAKIAAGGYPQAAGVVARLIGDPQPEIRQAAIDTLLTLLLPPQPVPKTRRERRAMPTGENRARQFLIDGAQPIRPVPASAFEPLVDAMSDADSPVRASASYAFGVLATSKHGLVPEASRTRALATLVKMITSPYQDTRILAMGVAGRAFAAPPDGDPPLVPIAGDALSNALVSAMNMKDMKDQRAAMEALGRLRERRALQSLSERFVYHREHGPRQHAVVALEALARIGDPATASLIRPLVDSVWTRRNDTRLAMLFARARLFNDGSEERLRRAADDKRNGAQARAYLLELGLVP